MEKPRPLACVPGQGAQQSPGGVAESPQAGRQGAFSQLTSPSWGREGTGEGAPVPPRPEQPPQRPAAPAVGPTARPRGRGCRAWPSSERSPSGR